jgi:3-oxoacyl-[acyl-carrier-protein] synthase-3
MEAAITAIEYHLPVGRVTNEGLARACPGRDANEIAEKTGIRERAIAAPGEWASDLAIQAARALIDSGACARAQIDFVLLCTQSPDYLAPATAALVHDRLGLSRSAGALDLNAGCSGWVYGLGLAKGLIETEQCERVLLLTAETYSKFIHPADRGTRSVFGDAAAATLIERRDLATMSSSEPGVGRQPSALGPFVSGTDGKGLKHLHIPRGGLRAYWPDGQTEIAESADGPAGWMHMAGASVTQFVLTTVPAVVRQLCAKAAVAPADVDLFVFHQANALLIDRLRQLLGLPREKCVITLADCGNTAASSIPIALKRTAQQGLLRVGDRVMFVGFGTGYSWAAALARWTGLFRSAADEHAHEDVARGFAHAGSVE